jgi:galactokinase/mevalonate kinase-like predicted kinase
MSDELKMSAEEALNIKQKLTAIFEEHAKQSHGFTSDMRAHYGQSAAEAAKALIKLDEHVIKMRMAVK